MKETMISLFLIPAGLALLAQTTDEFSEGGLPPVLKAYDEKGNRDGKIQREELPERLLRFFESTDLDGDGVLTWQEVDEAKARRLADLPRLEDVIGNPPSDTLDLLGGKLHEVGWSEGKLFDASRKREIAYLIRYPSWGSEDSFGPMGLDVRGCLG